MLHISMFKQVSFLSNNFSFQLSILLNYSESDAEIRRHFYKKKLVLIFDKQFNAVL